MEVGEILSQGRRFRRIGGGDGRGVEQNKRGDELYGDEEEDGEIKPRSSSGGGVAVGVGIGGGLDFASAGRLCGWPSSRIVRVSRASGGKDRHSKVLTSKGLRDRRVRLSVNTAIQFYDLQDRLGYDQPSKAVEWLLKAASTSIADLPPISTTFPVTSSNQLSEEKSLDSAKNQMELEVDPNCLTQQQQQQQAALPKSACSSNSENSKGSGLSLSRPVRRVKARERATAKERARVAEKEKDKEDESGLVFQHDHLAQTLNPPISQNASSFTELLTGGMNGNVNQNSNTNHHPPNGTVGDANFFNKPHRGHYSTAMDYFGSGLVGPSSTRTTHGFSGQLHLGNPLQQALPAASSPFFTFSGDPNNHHQELQQFSFVQDHFIPVLTTAVGNNGSNSNYNNSNEYNLNFTISSSSSSGLAGFSRGTLQSNSSSTPSLLPHIQRIPSIDGSSSTLFFGTAAQPNTAMENHHQLIPGFDARLQLCYGDGSSQQSDQKGKGKG